MNKEFADRFAAEWLAAWNAHDVDKILGHYADDFEMHSPAIALMLGKPVGVLRGKQAVRSYWVKALALVPELQFELQATLLGVDPMALYYKGARGRMVAEVFHFGQDKKVIRADAHYGI